MLLGVLLPILYISFHTLPHTIPTTFHSSLHLHTPMPAYLMPSASPEPLPHILSCKPHMPFLSKKVPLANPASRPDLHGTFHLTAQSPPTPLPALPLWSIPLLSLYLLLHRFHSNRQDQSDMYGPDHSHFPKVPDDVNFPGVSLWKLSHPPLPHSPGHLHTVF